MSLPNNKHPKFLWHCRPCTLWWLSEETEIPSTWRLIRLTEIENTADLLTKAPAWLVSGPSPSICPECGQEMIKHSVPQRTKPLSAIKN